jgi:hypothetical protein
MGISRTVALLCDLSFMQKKCKDTRKSDKRCSVVKKICFVFGRGLYSYHEISSWSVLISNIDILARKKS